MGCVVGISYECYVDVTRLGLNSEVEIIKYFRLESGERELFVLGGGALRTGNKRQNIQHVECGRYERRRRDTEE